MSTKIAVLIPLLDPRGDEVEHLRSWTVEQDAPPGSYRVVVGVPAGCDATHLRSILRPDDRIAAADPAEGLIGCWLASAAAAGTPWSFLTENHCVGDPDCVAAVLAAIEAKPDLEAFTVTHGHISASPVGRSSARWFDEVYADWDAGSWRRFNLAGFAIRTGLLTPALGFDPRYGLFAAQVLSARLHEQGRRTSHVPEARLRHVHPDRIQHHHEMTTNFVTGECVARSELPASFCDSYFGHNDLVTNARALEPRVARGTLRDVVTIGIRAPAGRRAGVLREAPAWAAAAAAGERPALAAARLGVAVAERVHALPGGARRRLGRYLDAQQRAIRRAQLAWLSDRGRTPPSIRETTEFIDVRSLGPDDIVGVHGLEQMGGIWFRWTHPVTRLLLAPGRARDTELRLETAGLRPDPAAAIVGVAARGRLVPREAITSDGDAVVIDLAGVGDEAGRAGCTIVCQPVPRSPAGEDRRLGLPLTGVGFGRA